MLKGRENQNGSVQVVGSPQVYRWLKAVVVAVAFGLLLGGCVNNSGGSVVDVSSPVGPSSGPAAVPVAGDIKVVDGITYVWTVNTVLKVGMFIDQRLEPVELGPDTVPGAAGYEASNDSAIPSVWISPRAIDDEEIDEALERDTQEEIQIPGATFAIRLEGFNVDDHPATYFMFFPESLKRGVRIRVDSHQNDEKADILQKAAADALDIQIID